MDLEFMDGFNNMGILQAGSFPGQSNYISNNYDYTIT